MWDPSEINMCSHGPYELVELWGLNGPSHVGLIWGIDVLTWDIDMGYKWAPHVGPI